MIAVWVLGLVLLAGLIAVVGRVGELENFVELTHRAEPVWLLAAVGLQSLTYVFAALVWWSALRASASPVAMRPLIRMSLIKLFVDQVIPTSGLGGNIAVATSLGRRGVSPGVAVQAMLVGIVSSYVGELFSILATIALLGVRGELWMSYVMLATAFSAFALLALAAIALGARWMGLPAVRKVAHRIGMADVLEITSRAPLLLVRDKALMMRTTLSQIAVIFLDAGTLVVLFRSLGCREGMDAALPALVLAKAAVTLSPIPTSLGTFEAVCVGVMVSLKVAPETALTATLLMRGLSFWLPIVPGGLLLRAEAGLRS